MKKIFIVSLLAVTFTSCCNDTRYRHRIGDVTEFKLNTTDVLILDTFYKNNQPYYRVKTDEGELIEVPEIELEHNHR